MMTASVNRSHARAVWQAGAHRAQGGIILWALLRMVNPIELLPGHRQ